MFFNKLIKFLLVIAVFTLLALFVHIRASTISPDPDPFYHIRHSWLYRTDGLFQTEFPWVQYSAIKQYGSDLWYGFHILILPLTYFQDLLVGIKWGGFLTTIIALILVFWTLSKLKIKWPLFWTLVFALITADVLYRLTMLRPHPISLGLSLLLFSFLIRDKLLGVFLVSLVFSFIHLSLFWIPLLIVFVVIGLRVVQKIKSLIFKIGDLKLILISFGGLLAGWLLRPNPFGAAKLAYIQLVDLILTKNLPLRFGRELTPFVWENFVDQLIPVSIILIIALAFLIFILTKKERWELSPQNQVAAFSSLILLLIFLLLTFSTARRANEFFIGFGIIFAGLLFSHFLTLPKELRRSIISFWQTKIAAVIMLAALVYAPFKTVYRYDTYIANAFAMERFREAALWLKNNTQPGEIVFNIHWDRFAQLFFWNYQNYYINGMDPIFEYTYNPSLYWKNHFLHIDEFFLENGVAYICGEIRCTRETVKDIHTILIRDFKASYIVVEKYRNPKLYKYLETAAGFQKVFETTGEAIFNLSTSQGDRLNEGDLTK